MNKLPPLQPGQLGATRDHLRDVALSMSSLQRAFLPKHPRQWQYGLEVTMRGLSTQAFQFEGVEHRATLDLVKQQVRLDGKKWPLAETDGRQIFEHFKLWLVSHMAAAKLEEPKFGGGHFGPDQAAAYAEALWWLDEQFRQLKARIIAGVTSPILLYPHHFDLSLAWFPQDDERQVGIGWSTGDETIAEPYLYLTVYPEPSNFKELKLPAEAYWQTQGFSGAILPYAKLQTSRQPEKLFKEFAGNFIVEGHWL